MDCSFIYPFFIFLWRLFKSTITQRRSRHSTDTVSEFHAEAPQATASEGLAQDPYVAARAGFEPTTIWSTDIDSTNEPPLSILLRHMESYCCTTHCTNV